MRLSKSEMLDSHGRSNARAMRLDTLCEREQRYRGAYEADKVEKRCLFWGRKRNIQYKASVGMWEEIEV